MLKKTEEISKKDKKKRIFSRHMIQLCLTDYKNLQNASELNMKASHNFIRTTALQLIQ